MSKTYYIFLAIVFLVSISAGFFAAKIYYSDSKKQDSLSIKEVKGDKKFREKNNKEECDFFVDVSGAVMNPGVVCVSEGAIVNEAIVKAGGFNPSAYAFKYVAQRINLARILSEEEKIYIPFRDDVVCKFFEDQQIKSVSSVMKGIDAPENIISVVEKEIIEVNDEKTDCININTASKEKIMGLKGIGEAKAGDIINSRPYSKIEDIKEVKGIGDKTFETLKDFICI